MRRTAPKTSVDILHERDALLARVDALETAMLAITEETARVAAIPELAFLTTRRIETVALGVLNAHRQPGPDVHRAQPPRERESSGIDVRVEARRRAAG